MGVTSLPASTPMRWGDGASSLSRDYDQVRKGGLLSSRDRYIIHGGIEGRERLRVLARAMYPTTAALLDRVVTPGSVCLDVGCGGGDVSLELARRVGIHGRVVGIDMDEDKIRIAQEEALDAGAAQVEYVCRDVLGEPLQAEYDLVYARFLVTHLPERQAAVARLVGALRPDGVAVLEDIDFAGSFCHPPNRAYDRYCELYTRTAAARGGDANIGRQLPALLLGAGCARVATTIVQPAALSPEGYERDVKLIAAVTMENIAESAILEDLTTREEVDEVVGELYRIARDDVTLVALPRVVQAVGYLQPA